MKTVTAPAYKAEVQTPDEATWFTRHPRELTDQ